MRRIRTGLRLEQEQTPAPRHKARQHNDRQGGACQADGHGDIQEPRRGEFHDRNDGDQCHTVFLFIYLDRSGEQGKVKGKVSAKPDCFPRYSYYSNHTLTTPGGAMVFQVKSTTQYDYNVETDFCYDSICTTPASTSSDSAHSQKRGVPFFRHKIIPVSRKIHR